MPEVLALQISDLDLEHGVLTVRETKYHSIGCNIKWKWGNEPDYV